MKPFSIIAAAIFLLIALVHLYRIAVGFPIMIGATGIGQAVSWAGLIVASVMAVGLFREGLRGNPHDIILTAEFDTANPNLIIVRPKTLLRPGNRGHFKFELDDQTGKNVSFGTLTSADDCSTCPPDTTKPNTQIYDVRRDNNPSAGKPRTAEFKNRNNNTRPRPMDVSYQWEFTCDPGPTVRPFDPIIANGGRM
jgi:hypothetical protein